MSPRASRRIGDGRIEAAVGGEAGEENVFEGELGSFAACGNVAHGVSSNPPTRRRESPKALKVAATCRGERASAARMAASALLQPPRSVESEAPGHRRGQRKPGDGVGEVIIGELDIVVIDARQAGRRRGGIELQQ